MLDSVKREKLHSVVAKGIFVCDRARPNIFPTISVLARRVREPTKSDWEKVRRMVKYLHSTKDLHLVLQYDGMCIAKWHVDASFAVHDDFCSQSDGVPFMAENSGGIASGSNRQ